VFSHLGETLSGISTIKAYKAEQRFRDTIQHRINENNVFFYPINVLDRWLEIYLGITGNLVILFATLFVIFSRDNLTGGQAGLSLTFALSVSLFKLLQNFSSSSLNCPISGFKHAQLHGQDDRAVGGEFNISRANQGVLDHTSRGL
jgi:ABC-type multidrug transport system fused ATPase/permease subunit